MKKQRLKTIGYAYASSPMALQLGHPKGCYYVGTRASELNADLEAPRGFATIEEAEAYANTLSLPYSKYSRRAERA